MAAKTNDPASSLCALLTSTLHHHQQGDLLRAKQGYQQILATAPQHAQALLYQGMLLFAEGSVQAALDSLIASRQSDDTQALTHYNLGVAYQSLNEHQNAINSYDKAQQLDPNDPNITYNLALSHAALDHDDQAMALYAKVVTHYPTHAKAWHNLGTLYRKTNQSQKAIDAYRQALVLDPQESKTHCNLAEAHLGRGEVALALEHYQVITTKHPTDLKALSSFLFARLFAHDQQPTQLRLAHEQWQTRYEQIHQVHETTSITPATTKPHKLNVGFISGDFNDHPVATFINGILSNRQDINTFCYYNHDKSNSATQDLKQLSDHWQDTINLNDEDLCSKIKRDHIHILIDLSGHTVNHRLGVFARRSAPIQMTYLGYASTTGISQIDYRITDSQADPSHPSNPSRPSNSADHQTHNSETLLRLPHCFLNYTAPRKVPPIKPKTSTECIILASCNQLAKTTDEMLKQWGNILATHTQARLVLKNKSLADADTCQVLRERLKRCNCDPNRVQLMGWSKDFYDHLDFYNQVDIALDTAPYNGTTTTCEALLMGVPVFSLTGKTHHGRVGTSILKYLSLDQWLAKDENEYQCKLGQRINELNSAPLRGQALRQHFSNAAICDSKAFTRSFESALKQTWQRKYHG